MDRQSLILGLCIAGMLRIVGLLLRAVVGGSNGLPRIMVWRRRGFISNNRTTSKFATRCMVHSAAING
jgi:hypothetical protein